MASEAKERPPAGAWVLSRPVPPSLPSARDHGGDREHRDRGSALAPSRDGLLATRLGFFCLEHGDIPQELLGCRLGGTAASK